MSKTQRSAQSAVKSGFTVRPIEVHGITLFAFDYNEFRRKENPNLGPFLHIVLRPSADSIGLNSCYFENLLRRPAYEDMKNTMKLIQFDPVSFDPDLAVQKPGRGSGIKTYQCLSLRKVEILLNDVDVSRVKDLGAIESILIVQKTVHRIIEAYYHDGVAVNKNLRNLSREWLSTEDMKSIASNLESIRLRREHVKAHERTVLEGITTPVEEMSLRQLLKLERQESDRVNRNTKLLSLIRKYVDRRVHMLYSND